MAARSKVHAIQFTVRGTGKFPFDMLRYDSCYPRTAVDAEQMNFDATMGDRRAPREVTLVSQSPIAPNADRWKSFLWHVSNIKQYI